MRHPRRNVLGTAAALAALVLLAGVGPAAAAGAGGFDDPASNDTSQQFAPGNVQRQDTPNDPNYDRAEPDSARPSSTNLRDERFDLFGFPSQRTPDAMYRDGPNAGRPMVSGYNAAGAWKADRGDSDAVVAILDTGIRWENASLRTAVHLNTGELPLPQNAAGLTDPLAPRGGFDLNRNGAVDVDDYAADPRVTALLASTTAKPTGQDLIRAFGHCQLNANVPAGSSCAGTTSYDNDQNGFANDIAGWDFFENDNDAFDRSSYFAARNHGGGRAQGAVEPGNDAAGSIGVCPHCQFIPIRVDDTFVSDGNTFGQGIVYGTQNGATVIEGANGSLTHTAFSEAASDYAYQQGVVQTYSGNDLNTGDHNYPANYSHVMEIQGTVPDTEGASLANAGPALTMAGLPSNAPVTTYFRGANTTQFGGHSSISLEGTTGSENTGKASGAAALVIAAARHAGVTLTPDETRVLLEQTAERVTQANTAGAGIPDPGGPGFTTHFGWGRANLGAAVGLARAGKVPPQAAISGPDWYAPITASKLRVTGAASARMSTSGFTYTLKWGTGLAPTAFTTVFANRSGTGLVTDFGDIDMAAVRAALATQTPTVDTGGPVFDPASKDPYDGQFTVQLEVSAPGAPLVAVDRRVFTSVADPTLRPGFPQRLGTGGEAPPRYADIDGDGVQELIVPGEDGIVRALRPDGTQLPGWPVTTMIQDSALGHDAAYAGLPPVRESPHGVVVADLDGDGSQEVATTAGTHLYVWEPDGQLRTGFPVSVDKTLCRPGEQSQPLRHRKCGFIGSPAAARLDGRTGPLSLVAAALDGHIYAWHVDGTLVPRFPVDLLDPVVPAASKMYAESIVNVTVSDLTGDGIDDLVAASNESYGAVSPSADDASGGINQGFADALGGVLGGSSRLYAVNGATGAYLPGWPVSLNGAIQNVLPVVGPGHDSAVLRLSGAPVVVASTTGGATILYGVNGKIVRGVQQQNFGELSNATDRSGVFNLFEYATVADLLGTGTPDVVKYGLTLGQVVNLALSGQNVPYNHLIGAYDATTGLPLPAWPRITDDYQLLSSSTIAKVVPGQTQQVLTGTGLGLLHAYDGATGRDVAGFPKVTGGGLFVPAAVSDDRRIAGITREGYLFEWSLAATAPVCQGANWPGFRHDPQNSGDYDRDGTPPGAPLSVTLSGTTLRFTSPGDDGRCGTPTRYLVWVDGRPVSRSGPVVAGGSPATLSIPAGSEGRLVRVAAADEVGNVGPAATLGPDLAAVVPEVETPALLALVGLLVGGSAVVVRRRRLTKRQVGGSVAA